jgi:hypothetical protein
MLAPLLQARTGRGLPRQASGEYCAASSPRTSLSAATQASFTADARPCSPSAPPLFVLIPRPSSPCTIGCGSLQYAVPTHEAAQLGGAPAAPGSLSQSQESHAAVAGDSGEPCGRRQSR